MCAAAFQKTLYEDDREFRRYLSEWNAERRERRLLRPTLTANFMRIEDGEQVIRGLHWGLIPFWAKDKKIGYSTFNARSEEAHLKPAFRESFKSKRGVLVLDTYVEWREEAGKKIPYEFGLHDEPICMAGLWASWGKAEDTLESCTLLTCVPNELAAQYHDRMPVILDQNDIGLWLDPAAKPEDLRALLTPFNAEKMFSKLADPDDFKRKKSA